MRGKWAFALGGVAAFLHVFKVRCCIFSYRIPGVGTDYHDDPRYRLHFMGVGGLLLSLPFSYLYHPLALYITLHTRCMGWRCIFSLFCMHVHTHSHISMLGALLKHEVSSV
jgi:hypothetical protein